jgi:hypothetical protein
VFRDRFSGAELTKSESEFVRRSIQRREVPQVSVASSVVIQTSAVYRLWMDCSAYLRNRGAGSHHILRATVTRRPLQSFSHPAEGRCPQERGHRSARRLSELQPVV